ncbi:hypothetical protein HYH03_003547 [Edaphochlamys debaryana]|uniref:SET domain-containing protein n=1 Tax=Edaphochlamys debaryana TaxID=47281 RepID=A0A835Y949_9CHLO|nr:hypothetical protein HYH03_003547 [Edaphochlamys debaryana]|eukprot:KAG2498286.1 hypothetical protein HYH03_003547 [Edaphochlamys debaryana]
MGDKSRFKPYVDSWPKPSEVVAQPNMDLKYVSMWKSEHWEKAHRDWHAFLTSLWDGSMNPGLEWTVKEMVGDMPISLADIKYAVAIAGTRYVASAGRTRLLMAPIYDMANHARTCKNYLSQYDKSDFLHLYAGEDLEAGDEICYAYGALRDDYAAAIYGFLPALEDPPRLAYVDHWQYKYDQRYSVKFTEEPFDGTPEQVQVEIARLQAIQDKLRATPDSVPKPKHKDYVYDMLKELERRRLNALEYEIKRLRNKLGGKTEL